MFTSCQSCLASLDPAKPPGPSLSSSAISAGSLCRVGLPLPLPSCSACDVPHIPPDSSPVPSLVHALFVVEFWTSLKGRWVRHQRVRERQTSSCCPSR